MGTGLADNASEALARVMPDDDQSRALQRAWLDWDCRARLANVSWQREWILTEELGQRTVLDVLQDFPVAVDRSPEPDRRFVSAAGWANELAKQVERRNRFGLALAGEDFQRAWLSDLLWKADSFVLVRGRYVPDELRRWTLSAIRNRWTHPKTDTVGATMPGGKLHAETEAPATQGVGPRFAGSDIWVLGPAIETRDPGTGRVVGYALQADYVRAADAAVPLPRWPGLTHAACLAKSLCLRYLIASLDADAFAVVGVHDIDEQRRALSAIHCPQTFSEIARRELGETVSHILDDVEDAFADAVRSGDPTDIAPPPSRSVTDAGDAEVYASEVLRHLGFTDARRTPGSNDGGVDVAGRHLVCQVKFGERQTTRPFLQQLTGVACVDRASAVFFSRADFSSGARDWAESTGMACFQFDTDGSLTAVTTWAYELLANGLPPPRPRMQVPWGPSKQFWESAIANTGGLDRRRRLGRLMSTQQLSAEPPHTRTRVISPRSPRH